MTSTVLLLNEILAFGALAAQGVILILLVLFFKDRRQESTISRFVSRWGLWIGFFVALFGSALTLVYSEIFGFVPCGLCWLQRVFLYPQVILFGLAVLKKDTGIADYIIALSVAGAAVGLYQHYLQMGGTDVFTCPSVGSGADCSKRILFEFGYITYPLLAATTFVFLIVTMMFVRGRR